MASNPKNSAKTDKAGRASRKDWIRTAHKLLADGGLRAITIDALCIELGLTKGSFYWHFNGRQELLSAMAESWVEISRRAYELMRQSGLSHDQQLKEIGKRTMLPGYGNTDRAMRIWAESCEETRIAVQKADDAAIAFLEETLGELGIPKRQVAGMARQTLAATVGAFAVAPYVGDRVYKDIEKYNQLLVEALQKAGK